MSNEISRRNLLAGGAAFTAAALRANAADERASKNRLKVCVFSKCLHFLQGEALADAVANAGFDGVDLTVRKDGHVEPARVKQDLPALCATMRKRGVAVPMISTDILDTDTPYTEDILKTAADLGIKNYRWVPPGGFKYVPDVPYPAQLERLKPRVAKLAALNSKLGLTAMWHTHSGVNYVGANIWDIYLLLKDFDPKAVGINYDIGHATVEGGVGGWGNSFHVTGPYLKGIAIKDVIWAKDARGAWKNQWVPLETGMIHLPQFLAMVAQVGFNGPVQLHFEYPLGGANSGAKTITIPQEQVFAALKRDLDKLRAQMELAKL